MKKIKVNEKLLKDSSFNPTKNTRQESIVKMCEDIAKGLLCLPLYQRDISWTLEKCISLLNYQLSGKAPVAPISMNEIDGDDDKVKHISFITREEITDIKPKYSVVDGQQRLTTNYKAYINDPEFRNVVLDLSKGYFTECKEIIKDNQIPVGVLLNKDIKVFWNYLDKHKALGEGYVSNVLTAIRNKTQNYYYTINSASNLTEEEQIEWFEVLNNAGSRVSSIQLRFSKLKANGIDIYTDYTSKYVEKLKNADFDITFAPKKTDVSYPIAALNPVLEKITNKYHTQNNFAPIPPDVKQNLLCSISEENLKLCFSETLEKLDDVIAFIEDYELKKHDRIDYVNYLIGYFTFTITPDYEYLVNWYNKIDFINLTNSERRDEYTKLIEGRA